MNALAPGTVIDIFISSESSTIAIDPQILAVLRTAADNRHLVVHMLVQSANNSNMASRLISAYMPLLVQGQLTLSVIQGTPQTFTVSTNILIPGCTALIVTEAVHRHPTAVATVIRDADVLQEMTTSFENSLRFARPMMTAYNDSFARSIIEVFFEEYGCPGAWTSSRAA